MIILSIFTSVATVAAIYFAAQNGKLSSTVEDKEMVLNALRAQSESDKLTIQSLNRRISHLESMNTASVKSTVTDTPSVPKRSRKPKAPKQA